MATAIPKENQRNVKSIITTFKLLFLSWDIEELLRRVTLALETALNGPCGRIEFK